MLLINFNFSVSIIKLASPVSCFIHACSKCLYNYDLCHEYAVSVFVILTIAMLL